MKSNGRIYKYDKIAINSVYGMVGKPEHPKEDPFPLLTTGDSIYSKVGNKAFNSLEPCYVDEIDSSLDTNAIFEMDEEDNVYFYTEEQINCDIDRYTATEKTLSDYYYYYYNFNKESIGFLHQERMEKDMRYLIYRRTEN